MSKKQKIAFIVWEDKDMGKYVEEAERTIKRLEEAKAKINESKEKGDLAAGKIASNKDVLASGIIESNKKIIKECDDAILEIDILEEEIINKAIEIDNRIEEEERRRKEEEEKLKEEQEKTPNSNR